MNPINDEMPSKNVQEDQKPVDLNKSSDISTGIENDVANGKQQKNVEDAENNDANDQQENLQENTNNLVVNDREANVEETENDVANEQKLENLVANDQQQSVEEETENGAANEQQQNNLHERTEKIVTNEQQGNAEETENGTTNDQQQESVKEETKIKENAIINSELEESLINDNIETNDDKAKENNSVNEDVVNEKDINQIENSKQEQTNVENNEDTNKENCDATEDANEKARDSNETFSEEEIEDFEEEVEDVEDVEIPGEGDVDEIIVPDDAEAEDLTDYRDNEEFSPDERDNEEYSQDERDNEEFPPDERDNEEFSPDERDNEEDLPDDRDNEEVLPDYGDNEEVLPDDRDNEEVLTDDTNYKKVLTGDRDNEEVSTSARDNEEVSTDVRDNEEAFPDDRDNEEVSTDVRDNEEVFVKSSHEDADDEEEETLKEGSDVEDNDEENSKSSEAAEKDGQDSNDKKSSNTDEKEDISSKDYEENEIDNLPTEPQLVALEEEENATSHLEESKSNEQSVDEEQAREATYDPLTCADNKEKNDENAEDSDKNEEISLVYCPSSENESATNDEDDEVQFVETRNSPICIESDDDDANSKETTEIYAGSSNTNESNQIITTANATVTVPKNLTVTRTSARKSTAKPQQQQHQQQQQQQKQYPVSANKSLNKTPQLQNKPKSLSYLQKATNNKRSFKSASAQRIVDCIELLDSSDEESRPSRGRSTPQRKTPQKRTLLGAKGNYYKNKNNSKTTLQNTIPTRPLTSFPAQIRQQPKKPAPPPLPPATPQSNFLNAVQLQPAAVTGANPPAFSALLSNKNVIIPNAFYGNPPSVREVNPEIDLERRYANWLESFLNQFCKPQFVPTHTCLVLLQRALKYKDFVRIKGMRGNMSCHGPNAYNQLNIQLMADLKTIFLRNTKRVTNYGRRFCELTCSAQPGKTMGLMSHSVSGKITLRTCSMYVQKSTNSAASSTSTSTTSSNALTNSVTRKRQLEEDEDEYTPDKYIFKTKAKPPSENGDEDSSEMSDDRKRSLRTKRTKRIDDSFSYNEDDLLAEYEINDEEDEKLAQVEIQRKIEQKRLEAQQQRQQQVKSFESAFIQAFAKIGDAPTTSAKTTKKNSGMQRVRLKNTTTATVTSIKQYTANNDAEDLLQATWIENLENDETQVISDDDEPKEHRIYKQKQHKQQKRQEQQQLQQHELEQQQQQEYHSPSPTLTIKYTVNSTSTRPTRRASKRIKNQEEIITGDDDYDEINYYADHYENVDASQFPKNIEPQMHVNGKSKDRCVICGLNCQRLVHHYVNEHRGCEVYNSRLSSKQIIRLMQGQCNVAEVSLYKNGQYQYEAFCIFCQKKSRFMFPYWYQHFTMHTGEYSYRCLGCGLRKPTRSLITQHQTQGCPNVGGIAQDYSYDSKSLHNCIEAKICSICNYVQLHRSNIVRHLIIQHEVIKVLPKHIQTVLLMTTPSNMQANPPTYASPGPTTKRWNARNKPATHEPPNTYVIDENDIDDDDDNDNGITYEEILPEPTSTQLQATTSENNYYNYIPPYMQAAMNSGNFTFEEVDAGDDLSFMICGMLDVQMNSDAN